MAVEPVTTVSPCPATYNVFSFQSVFVRVNDTERQLSSAHRVTSGQEQDGQQLKQASDTVASLTAELIQAADRERQLPMQLDKMIDDVSQFQKWLDHRPRLQKEFEDFKRHTSPQLQQEMKQRDSRFNNFLLPRFKVVHMY